MRVFLLWAILATGLAAQQRGALQVPMIPDSTTAVDVAKVLLRGLYGKDFLKRETFTVSQRDGLWIVVGRPKARPGRTMTGGVVELRLSAKDARVTYLDLQI